MIVEKFIMIRGPYRQMFTVQVCTVVYCKIQTHEYSLQRIRKFISHSSSLLYLLPHKTSIIHLNYGIDRAVIRRTGTVSCHPPYKNCLLTIDFTGLKNRHQEFHPSNISSRNEFLTPFLNSGSYLPPDNESLFACQTFPILDQ